MKKLLAVCCCACLPLCAAAGPNWKAVMQYDKQTAKEDLTQRLERYVGYNTQADAHPQNVPSTKGQLSFAKALGKELKQIGAENVSVSKSGVVTATIPATTGHAPPVIALLAHLDTYPGLSGADVKPQLHAKYNGGDILINKEQDLRLTEYNSPQLLQARSHNLLTASGGTLLGADGKAGIALIMTLADYLLGNRSIAHGTIQIAFLPDTENGKVLQNFDPASLGATYAYMVDGAHVGEIVTENFASRTFTAVFEGNRSADPGQAMNAAFADNVLMASDFHTLLPRHLRPETTSGTRGYIWVQSILQQEDTSTILGQIAAFTPQEMQELTQAVTQAFNTVKAMNPKLVQADLSFTDEYTNAKDSLPAPLLTVLQQAMRDEDIKPRPVSARRGTNNALLCAKGLPTVEVFSGVFNKHTALEYADIDVMEAALRTLISTAEGWADYTPQP